jgi:hypothetical protein
MRHRILLATVGFDGACGCPATNGPFAVSIPAGDVGSHVCCEDSITVTCTHISFFACAQPLQGTDLSACIDVDSASATHTAAVVFNGIISPGTGHNIELTSQAFDSLDPPTGATSLPVSWVFN